MNQTANSLGVETITLSQFLGQMGYKPQDRAVRLGSGARREISAPQPGRQFAAC